MHSSLNLFRSSPLADLCLAAAAVAAEVDDPEDPAECTSEVVRSPEDIFRLRLARGLRLLPRSDSESPSLSLGSTWAGCLPSPLELLPKATDCCCCSRMIGFDFEEEEDCSSDVCFLVGSSVASAFFRVGDEAAASLVAPAVSESLAREDSAGT